MKIAVVTVHYTGTWTAGMLLALKRLLAQVPSPSQIHVANTACAANALREVDSSSEVRPRIIVHDNIGLEFGAYQAGIDAARSEGAPDWLVFANDTFHRHQILPGAYLDNLALHLGRRVQHPIIVGQIEGLTRSFEFCGARTHRWITTNVFALNRPALDAIDWRIYDNRLEALITETHDPERFISPDVDPVLGEHITSFLFNRKGEYDAWYAAAPLSEANAPRLARKARSILQEKALSARLEGVSAEFASIRDISFFGQVAVRLMDRA